MINGEKFQCHKIADGTAEGELMVSSDDICFYLVDPKTGVVIEKGHALEGKSIAGKILVFPSGKGSSVVQADGLYQLQLNGKAPMGMIIRHPDTVLVASAIIMNIPMVDRVADKFYTLVKNGTLARVDSKNGVVSLL